MELKAKYEQRIEQAEAELRQVKNKILRISTLRVFKLFTKYKKSLHGVRGDNRLKTFGI